MKTKRLSIHLMRNEKRTSHANCLLFNFFIFRSLDTYLKCKSHFVFVKKKKKMKALCYNTLCAKGNHSNNVFLFLLFCCCSDIRLKTLYAEKLIFLLLLFLLSIDKVYMFWFIQSKSTLNIS